MEKAKKFIEDYTRRCSNAIAQPGGMWDSGGFEVVYQPWLTPEDALSALEIAKEEVIEDAYSAYCRICDTQECGGTYECSWLKRFEQAMKKGKQL